METSLFSRLSPELRNQIYEATFSLKPSVSLGPASGPSNAFHPLLRTCRQVRHEALSMYLTRTRFSVHLDHGPIAPLINWFQGIGLLCLLIHEILVFDMHNAMLSLWSDETVKKEAEALRLSGREHVELRVTKVGRVDKNNIRFNAGKYILDLQPALRQMGLDLRQGYEVYTGNGKEEFNGYCSWFVVTEAAGG